MKNGVYDIGYKRVMYEQKYPGQKLHIVSREQVYGDCLVIAYFQLEFFFERISIGDFLLKEPSMRLFDLIFIVLAHLCNNLADGRNVPMETRA